MATLAFSMPIAIVEDRKALAGALRRRDPGVLDLLIAQYQYRLFRYLLYLTRDREILSGCKYNLHPACPQCAREVRDTDRFCPYCGNGLDPHDPRIPQASS